MSASAFKDLVAADVSNVFLNLQEFAELRAVNGREMPTVLDDNELLERDKIHAGTHADGLYSARRLLYVAKADFGPRPACGALLMLERRTYRVRSCTEEAGMLAIELEAVRS